MENNAFIHEPAHGASILHVYGEVDVASSASLQQGISIAAQAGNDIVVDLGPCTYIDSTVLTVLMKAHRTFGDRFWIVVPLKAAVRRLFEVTSLLNHLPIVGTLEETPAGSAAMPLSSTKI